MKDVKATDSFVFKRTGHLVKNRSVLAAMTNKQSHEDGTISDNEIKWLVRRASSEFESGTGETEFSRSRYRSHQRA